MFDLVPLEKHGKNWFEKQDKKHLYLSELWLKTMAKTYNFEVLLLVDENDRLHTAFCKLDDMMGKRLSSLPFSDYLPYGERDSDYFQQVFDHCRSVFPDYEILLKTDRKKDFLSGKYTLAKEAVYHSIDLSTVSKAKQSSSFKRGKKQAVKNGISTRINNSVIAITDFYRLYHRLRFDKFGIIPQPFSFFENLFDLAIKQQNVAVFEALLDEKVIASMIILTYGKTAYYKYGCSAMEHLQLKPNNLLFHHLINHFKAEGFENIDLGLSGAGESYAGLRRWKSSMGGEEQPISYWSSAPSENGLSDELIGKNKAKIRGLTNAIVRADLGPQETSLLSEQIYPLLA